MIVEDEPDMRTVIKLVFKADPRFEVDGEASSAAEAIEVARSSEPGLIVLDHGLQGAMTGIDAAPSLKRAAPRAKIILFSAHNLAGEAAAVPEIDAFVLKTDIGLLLPTACRLLGLEPTHS